MYQNAVLALALLLASWNLFAERCEQQFVEFEIITSEAQREIFLQFSVFLLNGFSKDRSCVLDLESNSVRCRQIDAPDLRPGKLKFSDLRDYYQERWLSSRDARGHSDLIPANAIELEQKYNFRSWPKTVIEHSAIKQERRTIYRNPTGPRISIAEVASGKELELAIETAKDSGNYEFYAYSEKGDLTNTAIFPVGPRPAPGICVACHFNSSEGKVNRFIPAPVLSPSL